MEAETKKLSPSTAEQRKERNELSAQFLDKVMLVGIQAGVINSSEEISEMYQSFCKEHAVLTNTFDLAHVWSIAWKRNHIHECLAETDPNQLPADAADVVVALGLLEKAIYGHQT